MAPIEAGAARAFQRQDVPALLALMQDLARFEGYERDFRVTAEELVRHGLCKQPLFCAYVVPEQHSQKLLGMAVTFVVPWTYTLLPKLVLKELYVTEKARGLGVGRKLMRAVLAEAKERGAFKVQWSVLTHNDKAKRFYHSLGATHDAVWENWELAVERLP